MKKITLFTADIDTKAIIKQLADYKQSLEQLKVAQKGLDTSTAQGAEQFVKNQVAIKKTRAESNKYEKVLIQLESNSKGLLSANKSLERSLKVEVKTINQARESNKKLLAVRNNLNLKSKEGVAAQKRINAQLDKNNAFIKKNVSGYEKQKISIGDYKGGILAALGGTRLFGGALGGITTKLASNGKVMLSNLVKSKASTIQTKKQAVATTGLGKGLGFVKVGFIKAAAGARIFSMALISTGIGAIIVALGVFIGLIVSAVKNSKEFAKSQSTLKAVLGGTAKEMKALNRAAKELGKSTEFTATQVSDLQTEFAKLGFPTEDILQMTESTLNAASAMGSGLAETAKLTGAVLNGFGLEANETAKVNDILATATVKTALDFEKLARSMATIAPVAKASNFSLADTTSLLGALSDAGFDAGTAATSTRKILLNLADSNGKLAKSLNEPVKDLPSLIKGLKQLKGEGIQLGEALEITDVKSVAAFNTFLEGTEKLEKLSEAFNEAGESGGAAAKAIAETKLDNLAGDTTKLTSAWQGLLLSIEDGQGVFSKIARFFVQNFTKRLSTITKAIEFLGFGFNDLSVTVELYFGKAVNYVKKASLDLQLSFSEIPIIGRAIDAAKVRANLNDVIKEIDKASETIEKRGTIAERFAADQARITFAAGAKDREAEAEAANQKNAEEVAANAKANAEYLKGLRKRLKAEVDISKLRLKILEKENKESDLLTGIQQAEIVREGKLKILKLEEKEYQNSAKFKTDVEEERTLQYLKFSNQRAEIDAEFVNISKDIAIETSETLIEEYRKMNGSRIKDSEFVNKELFDLEAQRIDDLYIKEIEQLESLELSAAEYKERLNIINEEARIADDENNQKRKDTLTEQELQDYENLREIRADRGNEEFELKIEELERLRAEELRIAEETGADIALINEKYDNKVGKVDDLSSKQKVDNAAKAAGQISGIMKQLAGENKEIAITAAIIDGALGIQSILAEYPKFDGGFAMVAAIAASAITTATSLSTIQKAEDGISFQGTLKGASHANGGINLGNGIEAEGGENMYTSGGNTHIVNKKASSLINRLGIMGALSFINQREGGGIALSAPTSYAQKGGLISTLGGGSAEIDYSKMAQAFEAGASRVQNTVNVNDINSANNSITQVNDFTTI